jgi:Mini-chromosome maintenance replisome factor
MEAAVQCLIISEAKSNILPADLVVPVCPSAVTPLIASEQQLCAWRWYLATVRALPYLNDTSICEVNL